MRWLLITVGAVSVAALTVMVAPSVEATVSGEDGKIAFVGVESGVSQIYIVDRDGSHLESVTDFSSQVGDPGGIKSLSWSPDGRSLAFSGKAVGSSDASSIWTINADGTDLRYITAGSFPSWAPNGRLLAYSKPAVGQTNGLSTSVLATVDLDTRVETVLTDPGEWVQPGNPSGTTSDRLPVWMPDGSSIFFVRHFPGSASISTDSILQVTMSGGPAEPSPGGGLNISGLDVAPSGDALLRDVVGITQPWGSPWLSEVDLADGEKVRVETPSGLTASGGVGYAPSGDALVATLFATDTGQTNGIWIRDRNGAWTFLAAGRDPVWQPVNPYPMGLVDPATGMWHLRDAGGKIDTFYYGNPGDTPFMGDWDCDGTDTPGLYRQSDGYVYLRNSNTQGTADISFYFGNPGDVPLAGDFNGDGCDSVSLYRASEQRFYIINHVGTNDDGLGAAEYSFVFGNPQDKPFVGDFNGDGQDTIGLHRESTGLVYFRNTNTTGIADHQFYFGDPGDRFVTADWNHNGTDSPAVYRPSIATHYFRFTNTEGTAEAQYIWGDPDWLPITGTYTHN